MTNKESKLGDFLDKLNEIEADTTERINTLLKEYGLAQDDIRIIKPVDGSGRYFSFFISVDKIF